ncbi:hypothetical protein CFP59_00050 [Streptomyces malaysiensis subsp. malaysiensis]|uniref:hypothetical protein n=1 Tax=Streptomyces malaysiensis TaxID=92644 RepID=UPI000CA3CA66|nr:MULTISPECIES: hypothetical protein [unclassified Streptomyces]AUA07965.1 hypothetical protein CFP59_00050 [Streptomyces sp. M56]
MSLTSGLHSPRTPLRRFLDRELSAGPRPLRESYRAQHRTGTLLLPPPGVGTEAGAVGTAIDQRLRLAFTRAAPIDAATRHGIALTASLAGYAGARMHTVGNQLAARLTATIEHLRPEDRDLPVERGHDEEEHLARLLLAAAWYQVLYRAGLGFLYTPLARSALEDPAGFTLTRLLQLPHRDLVSDVVAQLHRPTDGPLAALRARTLPTDCTPGPAFPGTGITADADLVVDGLLLDFKSTRHPAHLDKSTAWQLLGYLLLDTADHYRIDTVGLYLTRSGVLAGWPVEQYLDLLGTCRRDLLELRTVTARLLAGCPADMVPRNVGEQERADRLLDELTPVIPAGHCPVCAQPLPQPARRSRKFCSRWCATRSQTLHRQRLVPARSRGIVVAPQVRAMALPPARG